MFFACDKKAARREVRRHGAHPARRGARPDRPKSVPSSAGSSTSRCTSCNEDTEQDRLQPQPVLDAAGRARGAEHQGPADDQGASSTTSSATASSCRRARSATTGRRSCTRPSRSPAIASEEVEEPLRRHAQRLQVRRAAAWRLGARHRPHRHAAGRRAEHPRGHRLPDEPAGARIC